MDIYWNVWKINFKEMARRRVRHPRDIGFRAIRRVSTYALRMLVLPSIME